MFEEFEFLPNIDEENDILPLFSIDEEDETLSNESYKEVIPMLALKNTVLFPGIIIPITVGRKKSLKALEKAYEDDRIIAVLSQKEAKTEDPTKDDLYGAGTIARIIKILNYQMVLQLPFCKEEKDLVWWIYFLKNHI